MEVVESKLKIVIMLLHVCVVYHYGKCCAALGPFLRPQKIQKHLKSDLGGREGKGRREMVKASSIVSDVGA